MKIKNSLEWYTIESELMRQSQNLVYSVDVRKMIANIKISVAELSRAEVIARRSKNYRVEEMLVKINDDIDIVEEYILVAALLG